MSDPTISNQIIRDWVKRSDGMKSSIQLKFGVLNTFNYRIYRSWEDVQLYHYSNVRSLSTRAKKLLTSRTSLANAINLLKQSKG